MTVLILPAVVHDVAETATWYDQNGWVGLGDRFIEAFRGSVPRIRASGSAHRVVYLEFRRILI